jgi:GntR family transcriptional regulator
VLAYLYGTHIAALASLERAPEQERITMPEVQQSVPQHLQVADYYKQQILDGVIQDGERMPSVRAIRTEWNVGHNVAQRAIDHLKTGGLVRTTSSGTFATPGRAVYGPQQRLRAETHPANLRFEVRAAEIIPAPEYVIPILGLEPDEDGTTRVLRREWLTYINGDPAPGRLSVLWCPPGFAGPVPELLAAVPLPGDAAKLIGERTGSPLTWGRTSHEARPAKHDGREIPLLQLGDDAHVSANVYIWTSRDRVMVYVEFIVPEGRVIEADMAP